MAAKKQLMKPAVQKVVKDAKPNEIAPKIISDDEYLCTCCGHKYRKQETNFNRSKSPIYNGNNGFMSICRNCVAELFERYIKFFDGDEDAAAERICQIIDIYFDKDIWAMSRKISNSQHGRSRNRISTYISKLNLTQSGGGTTYLDTLVRRYEADVSNAETIEEVETNDDITVPVDVVRRFGTGFEEGDYESMQNEYQDWVNREGEPIDKRQEELYISICYMKLNLQKLLQKGDANIGSAASNFKAQIEAATVEIEDRKKKAEADTQLEPLGVMIRDIEEFCPSDFYKDKKIYSDHDYLKSYISRFILRPLRNLLTGSKEMDKEFNLSNTEE